MKQRHGPQHLWHFLLSISVLTVWLFPAASAAQTCEKPVATVVAVQVTVEVQREERGQWQPVQLQDTYCPGDTIRVQEKESGRRRTAATIGAPPQCQHHHYPRSRQRGTDLCSRPPQGRRAFFQPWPEEPGGATPFTV